MTIRGTVRGGVVVLPEDVALPDGAEVDVVVADVSSSKAESSTIWDKLADLGLWAETLPTDLPTDLAENHDHYLHGRPKRQ